VQDVYREAIHGLPPWDGRAMALHTQLCIDDVDVLSLAVCSLHEEDASCTTKHLFNNNDFPFFLSSSARVDAGACPALNLLLCALTWSQVRFRTL
jgi:hypothetical protein